MNSTTQLQQDPSEEPSVPIAGVPDLPAEKRKNKAERGNLKDHSISAETFLTGHFCSFAT